MSLGNFLNIWEVIFIAHLVFVCANIETKLHIASIRVHFFAQIYFDCADVFYLSSNMSNMRTIIALFYC